MSSSRGTKSMMHHGAKPKNALKTIFRILKYMSGYKFQLAAVAFGILLSSLAGVAGTYYLKPIINDYIVPYIGSESPNLSGFLFTLSKLGAIYLTGVLSTYVYSRLIVNICAGTLTKIRRDLFSHMQKLPVRFFDTNAHGDLMSRFTGDTDALREMISQGLPNLLSSLVSVIGIFLAMVILSPVLSILAAFMLALMIFTVGKIGKKSAAFFKEQQKDIGAINGYIEEIAEGIKEIKVFCHEEKAREEFRELNERLFRSGTAANTYANILMPIMGNLSYASYAIIAAAGAALAIIGIMDLGTIASFLQYTRSISQPVTQISQQFRSVLMALAGAERIFKVLDEPVERDNGMVTLVHARETESGLEESKVPTGVWAWKRVSGGKTEYIKLRGDVRLYDVSFGYNPGQEVLKNITLWAKQGQKIAFVGSTGAGKTTITNLINRFYDLPGGKITYDGIDINEIKKADLRRSLAMVLQDTHLFTGTVRENIRYGRLDATDEEVEAAARLANAYSFIMRLPQGFDTVLTSDGANLSQGQRQLLAIARAAVANPPVLILDEATSSIDTRTEALIEKGMDKLMAGRTVFVIAHRLSTVRNANAIMVLENGEIIERGSHEELLAQKGRYHKLYTGMFELS